MKLIKEYRELIGCNSVEDAFRYFKDTINNSIIQTFARSMNTSLTVLIVLLSMFLLGGETIRPFILALLIGIAVGTYSSIFNATPLLYIWQNAIDRRLAKSTSE